MEYTAPPTNVEDQQPDRALQHQKRRSPYGKTPVPLKAQKGHLYLPRHSKTVFYESKVEHDCLLLLSYDQEVRHIDRAAPVTYHAADGTPHIYTPDYDITRRLGTGQDLLQTLEVKPSELVLDIISDDPLRWAACADIVRARGSELLIVTDQDLKPVWVEHAKRFSSYQMTPGEPEFESLILNSLIRGPLTFQTLRVQVMAQLPAQTLMDRLLLRLDSTLSSLIARGTVTADTGMKPDQHCLIGLPGQIQAEPLQVRGVAVTHLVRQVYASNHQPDLQALTDDRSAAERESAIHLESKLLATHRGKALQKLFSLYSDPSLELDAAQIRRLRDATGIPRRTIFRFRTELQLAGAPGITFSELAPHLHSQRQRPTHQLDEDVQAAVSHAINTMYLVPVGTTGRCTGEANLHHVISEACEVIGKKPPALSTILRQLQSLRDCDPLAFEVRRNGADAGHKLDARLGEYPVLLYGELLAIDCTPIDAFMTLDGAELRPRKSTKGASSKQPDAVRGNVLQIIEVATRQVLSSTLHKGGINATMVLRALQPLLRGDYGHAASRGVIHLPTFAGLPRALRLDRGLEFANQHVARVVESLGIQVIPRNKSSRHHGGVEERAIRTVVSAHHILPGTTMSNIEARQGYRAPQGAKLDFETLDTYHQRMVEVYNRKPAPQRAISRNEHASQLIAEGAVAIRVPSAQELQYIQERMLPQRPRICQRNGLYIFSLTYRSQEAAFRGLVIQRRKVEVVFDPDDISTIHAVHPDSGLLIPVAAKLPDGVETPISLTEWERLHRRLSQARKAKAKGLPSPQKVLKEALAEIAAAKAQPKGRRAAGHQNKLLAAKKAAGTVPAKGTFTDDGPVAEVVPFYHSKEPA